MLMEYETKRRQLSPATPPSSPSASASPNRRRNYDDLPSEITFSILSRLGAIDILTSVQNVCRSWRAICMDPLMWRVIDMRIGTAAAAKSGLNLEKICCLAVFRSCGQVVDIAIKHVSSDELLKYITHRSSGIRRLRFVRCCIGEGLIEVALKLRMLEELDFSLCGVSVNPSVLEVIGRSCPRLKSLKLNRDWRRCFPAEFNNDAYAIARTMPGLKDLQIFGNKLTKEGVMQILDGCPRLESLDLRHCYNLRVKGELEKRLTRKIKKLRLPSDSAEDYEFYVPNSCHYRGIPYDVLYHKFLLDDNDNEDDFDGYILSIDGVFPFVMLKYGFSF